MALLWPRAVLLRGRHRSLYRYYSVEKIASSSKEYQKTLNLPSTSFPMRYEPLNTDQKLQARCCDDLYAWQEKNFSGEPFVLHDGPPFANGKPHVGHALNHILKDFVVRYQLLKGQRVSFIPGWDCHGLPIEIKALERLKTENRRQLTPMQIRQLARNLALEAIEIQRDEFRSWSLLGDWANPYRTLDPAYEAAQLSVFASMVDKGLIYRDYKPVYWSPSSSTALAEAELEYSSDHRSESVYVRFPVIGKDYDLLIWTTTPWTLPSNQAVSINPALQYCLVSMTGLATRKFLVARDRVEALEKELECSLVIHQDISIEEVLSLTYQHPIYPDQQPSSLPVLAASHVTASAGTGVVHTAPAHGLEDYKACKDNNIHIRSALVNGDGRFLSDAGPLLEGKSVLTDGTQAVIEYLQHTNNLIKHRPIYHRYPYDWRTKKPIILRATEQWFCRLSSLSNDSLQSLADVNIVPAISHKRLGAMLTGRDDWCISRQRSWGVPIPVFYDDQTGEALLNQETIQHVRLLFEKHGSDCWWTLSESELLPSHYLNNGKSYRKGSDTMDVWFDSGTSWAALKQRLNYKSSQPFRADLFLEGSDQHRGWFQSSLLTSVATQGISPYKTLVTHGFVLDQEGKKMSKSLGNGIDPSTVVAGGKDKKKEPAYGSEVLRLWVASTDFVNDVTIGPLVLEKVAEAFRKLRNTMRFMVAVLGDFHIEKNGVDVNEMEKVDQYMLHVIYKFVDRAKEDYDAFTFNKIHSEVNNLAATKLSSFYFEMVKDRLYADPTHSHSRRSAQTALFHILHCMTRVLLPVLPLTAESVFDHYRHCLPSSSSIPLHQHNSLALLGWPKLNAAWHNPDLAEHFALLTALRNDVSAALEVKRASGMFSVNAMATVKITSSSDPKLTQAWRDLGARPQLFFNVAQVELQTKDDHGDKIHVDVQLAHGHKCPRCWNYHSSAEGLLCSRCQHALQTST